MTEETISAVAASRMSNEIDTFVESLVDQGFSRQMIGTGMSGVGLAMVHANGGDFVQIVENVRALIERENTIIQ